MEIKQIDTVFLCAKYPIFPQMNGRRTFCFLSKTDEEPSLVCPTAEVPSDVAAQENGWKAFRI